jgi:hypothetical protein
MGVPGGRATETRHERLGHRSYNRVVAELLNYLRGDASRAVKARRAGPTRPYKYR